MTWSSRVSEWYRLKLVDVADGRGHRGARVGRASCTSRARAVRRLRPRGAAERPLDEEGFLRTGDIFEIAGDQNQYLHYVDRAKDLIIRGGMNIAPAELEGMIAEHPAVLEATVVGDPDEALGERVAAVVVLRPDASLTLAELVEHLRAHKIASYKLPERLELVEALPRNPVGKILKRELRRRLQEESARA